MKQTEENKSVTDYWLTFYTTSGICDLCANTGRVRMHDAARKTGTTFCFCPNGQTLRIHHRGSPIKSEPRTCSQCGGTVKSICINCCVEQKE